MDKKPQLPEEHIKLLEHETFITEVERARAGEKKEGREKSWRDLFFSPAVAVALVTFVTTGIFGTIITYIFQNKLKEREYQQAIIKSEADQALVAYKEYLEKEVDVVTRAFTLIGDVVSGADDLIFLTQKSFAPGLYKDEALKKIQAQREAMKTHYDETEARWRRERYSIGLLMSYYHQASPDVSKAWKDSQDAVNGYVDYAVQWYSSNQPAEDIGQACSRERESLDRTLEGLSRTIESKRRYFWKIHSPGKTGPAL